MSITVSTTPPDSPHEPLDTITAVGESNRALFTGGPHMDEALEKCKEGLRKFAADMGADAVVSCQFEIKFDRQVINMVGFGTAVRWKDGA